MPKKATNKTLKQLHAEVMEAPTTVRKLVLSALGAKTNQTFYDILKGTRKLNEAEKKAIAEIYEVDPAAIDWKDAPQLIA